MKKHIEIFEFLIFTIILLSFDFIFLIKNDFHLSFIRVFLDFLWIVIVFSIVSLIKNKKTRFIVYNIVIVTIFSFFLFDITLYYYKKDITSMAMLLESFRDSMRIGIKYSPLGAFPLHAWLLIIGFVVIGLIGLNKVLKNLKQSTSKVLTIKNVSRIIVSLIAIAITSSLATDYQQMILETPNDKVRFIENFGSITYHVKDMTSFAQNMLLSKNKEEEFVEDLDDLIVYDFASETPYFGSLKNKNIIMIMTETNEEYAYSRKYTPNYFELYDQSMYFDNFFSAAKANYTYDAEFKSLTSMMYFESDNYMYTYGKNTFQNALPWVLSEKGYTTNSFHNYLGTFFNRKEIHYSLGFDNFYAKEDMEFSETMFWPKDSEMFLQSLDLIAPIQDEPFFSFVITVTTHGPFNEYREELSEYYDLLYDDEEYKDLELEFLTLKAAQMDFDKGLGYLLQDLEEKALLDDTVIIIFSDHKNYSSLDITLKYSNNLDIPLEVEKVPLIFYNPTNKEHSINSVLSSQYDLTPTLFDLLGIKYYKDFYYGESLFSESREDKPIILAHSTWIKRDYRIEHDQVLYGEALELDIENERILVFDTIEFFKKLFVTDYFANRKTIED